MISWRRASSIDISYCGKVKGQTKTNGKKMLPNALKERCTPNKRLGLTDECIKFCSPFMGRIKSIRTVSIISQSNVMLM